MPKPPKSQTEASPTNTPPEAAGGPPSGSPADAGHSRPRELSGDEQATTTRSAGSGNEPTREPPAASSSADAALWRQDVRVNALWSINQNRNSWMSVNGVGWRQLAPTSDSGIVALTILASHGKQTQTRVDYREEADGKVYEIYAW
jgi:hypothetical protein